MNSIEFTWKIGETDFLETIRFDKEEDGQYLDDEIFVFDYILEMCLMSNLKGSHFLKDSENWKESLDSKFLSYPLGIQTYIHKAIKSLKEFNHIKIEKIHNKEDLKIIINSYKKFDGDYSTVEELLLRLKYDWTSEDFEQVRTIFSSTGSISVKRRQFLDYVIPRLETGVSELIEILWRINSDFNIKLYRSRIDLISDLASSEKVTLIKNNLVNVLKRKCEKYQRGVLKYCLKSEGKLDLDKYSEKVENYFKDLGAKSDLIMNELGMSKKILKKYYKGSGCVAIAIDDTEKEYFSLSGTEECSIFKKDVVVNRKIRKLYEAINRELFLGKAEECMLTMDVLRYYSLGYRQNPETVRLEKNAISLNDDTVKPIKNLKEYGRDYSCCERKIQANDGHLFNKVAYFIKYPPCKLCIPSMILEDNAKIYSLKEHSTDLTRDDISLCEYSLDYVGTYSRSRGKN